MKTVISARALADNADSTTPPIKIDAFKLLIITLSLLFM